MSHRVEVRRLGAGGLTPHREVWRRLEARAGAAGSLYTSYDWLSTWLETYGSGDPMLVRIDNGETSGLALLETGRRRWRFAGHPISCERGLLSSGDDVAAWSALAGWLAENPGAWLALEGEGVTATAGALPGAELEPIRAFGLDLPDSFEEYLSARVSSTRRRLRQRWRYFERASGEIVEADDLGAAMHDLLRLHHDRARRKGERHPQLDERLAPMIERLASRETVTVLVTELWVARERLGMALHIEHRGVTYFYNGGIREVGTRLSPGIVLELDAIRRAIERGSHRFDLGPGAYRYKEVLGGIPETRYRLAAFAPTSRGWGAARYHRALRSLRSSAVARHLRRAIRR